ncbi:hypothetical protein [Amycolatopsis benzoatilytica]|uniref:hypothetical protein n=1 Tax=Amycolatopsis benzoatilytica TaxID=346045 RepID=UPI00039C0F97|nr:hypothetical protein [Amycolatopsis benzoatilytica]
MPPSRRQPPRSSSTPPARRPKVAGLRKPSDEAPAASPKPRPRPRPLPDADPAEVTQELRIPRGGLVRPAEPEPPAPAGEDTPKAVVDLAEPEAAAADAAEVDAITGEAVEEVESDYSDDADDVAAEKKAARPSPRRKQRDSGTAKPADVEEAESKTRAETDSGRAKAPTTVNRTTVLVSLLVVIGLALTAAAVIFQVKGSEASDSTSNRALLDVAKTAQVKDQVSKAIESLFSYDYNNIKKTEDAANKLLATDQVRNSYNLLMGQVKKFAPEQKVVVTCKVTRSAVIRLNGDLARVMLFIDQTSTRTDTKQTAAGSAQMHVDAQLQGDTWKITDMDTYKPPAAPASPAPAQPPASSAPPSK